MKPSDPGLFFVGKFLITDLTFLLVVLRIFFQILLFLHNSAFGKLCFWEFIHCFQVIQFLSVYLLLVLETITFLWHW